MTPESHQKDRTIPRCKDCGTDISDRNYNATRCWVCRKENEKKNSNLYAANKRNRLKELESKINN